MRGKERSATGEGVSKLRWYGNEVFNYGWIHYQIKAKDLLFVYVVWRYRGTPQTPVNNSELVYSRAARSLHSSPDWRTEIRSRVSGYRWWYMPGYLATFGVVLEMWRQSWPVKCCSYVIFLCSFYFLLTWLSVQFGLWLQNLFSASQWKNSHFVCGFTSTQSHKMNAFCWCVFCIVFRMHSYFSHPVLYLDGCWPLSQPDTKLVRA